MFQGVRPHHVLPCPPPDHRQHRNDTADMSEAQSKPQSTGSPPVHPGAGQPPTATATGTGTGKSVNPIPALRKRLKEGRQVIRARHDTGASGPEVCRMMTDLVDSIVLDIYRAAVQQVRPQAWQDAPWCLVAHGGYGRRDLAPFSDVDLMLLYDPAEEADSQALAKLLHQWINDTGLHVGFAMRTDAQSWKLAWTDASVITSLAESRLLIGSIQLYLRYFRGLRLGAQRRAKRLIAMIEAARLEERRKYGETIFLLEPNIKRSRGGLRDVQLVRWLGFVRHGETDLRPLIENETIPEEDARALERGYHYLLRIRNQMHFESQRAQDQLDRAMQMRLAEWAGWRGAEGILPVEQFMQEYFEHTSEIRYASAHMLDNVKWQSPLASSLQRSVGMPVQRDFRVGFRYVWATRTGLERLKRDPAAVIELMAVSSRYGKPIDPVTWREIRMAMRNRKITQIDQLTIERFLDLMSQSTNLAEQLRRLHELRVLEQIIPPMQHARCLLQFNQYHKYTVDAHSIRAIECVTELEQDRTGLLGSIYRSLRDKTILHLALLLHDLGKGYPEDHSEVGARIAAEMADRLKLNAQDKETLVFLVHKHLLMVHTAFRFDLSDDDTAVRFAATVGSSERLQLLLLLTYADLASVGPGVVNEWKIDLLLQLYYQTDAHFRDERPGEGFHEDILHRRDAIRQHRPRECDAEWWDQQVDALPIGYLIRTPAALAATELARLRDLETKHCLTWGRFLEQQKALEFVIATRQTGRPIGTFHRMTGVLSSMGMQIIAAEIHTQPDDIAWDRFLVQDTEYEGSPPPGRIDAVCQAMEQALAGDAPAPCFRDFWKSRTSRLTDKIQVQPTQVRFDNSTSDKHTIITLFAYDRMGLLYSVSKVLFEMELILHSAKISTHLDQVVDVFYVTDMTGQKITESTRLYMIRQRLLQAVNSD
ncbi:MAG: [protein-PII] uridylyltransferase [Planctomycetota bacterium]|nr:MAG: [protein-PII] uridylyltransferase [Planctomycetota bacterium]